MSPRLRESANAPELLVVRNEDDAARWLYAADLALIRDHFDERPCSSVCSLLFADGTVRLRITRATFHTLRLDGRRKPPRGLVPRR